MINWAHIHLLVNDVPILGSLFAALFFIVALRAPQRDTWARAGLSRWRSRLLVACSRF
jgi:hypothetical protein